MHKITKEQLLLDLYVAYFKAVKHKKSKKKIKDFNSNVKENLLALCNELYERKYTPQHSNVFIITDPKKREVFAAAFRDRIVHHLYYEYTHELFEKTFIHDSYSCIKGKGTHFGIKRLEHHIKSCSLNYTQPTYILKMDLKGYFIHINRNILLNIVRDTLNSMRYHRINKESNELYDDIIDFEFVDYLTHIIVLLDPTEHCNIRSPKRDWNDLPSSKSLFKAEKERGLPIGNLTSQLFSNVYLNKLDQFVKRELKCKHYGRYVDDFYIVHDSKPYLHSIIPKIEAFVNNKLDLEIQKGKTIITSVKQGVEFLGAYIKPHRTYVSNQCIRRIKRKLPNAKYKPNIVNTINSYLGVFSHFSSNKAKCQLFNNYHWINECGKFNEDMTKFSTQ